MVSVLPGIRICSSRDWKSLDANGFFAAGEVPACVFGRKPLSSRVGCISRREMWIFLKLQWTRTDTGSLDRQAEFG